MNVQTPPPAGHTQRTKAEEWRPTNRDGYEVSNFGRVRNASNRILKPRRHTHGYIRVNLKGGIDAYVHRLVCRAFNGPPPFSAAHVHHINSVRDDNRPENLMWVSAEQNRALRNIAKGERSGNAKLNARQVREIKSAPWHVGFDRKKAKELGVSRETVRDVRLGKVWSHVD